MPSVKSPFRHFGWRIDDASMNPLWGSKVLSSGMALPVRGRQRVNACVTVESKRISLGIPTPT